MPRGCLNQWVKRGDNHRDLMPGVWLNDAFDLKMQGFVMDYRGFVSGKIKICDWIWYSKFERAAINPSAEIGVTKSAFPRLLKSHCGDNGKGRVASHIFIAFFFSFFFFDMV